MSCRVPRKLGVFRVILLGLLASYSAVALPQGGASAGGPASDTTPAGDATDEDTPPASCVERLPQGRERPRIEETFPTRGLAGHAAKLVVEVHHLPGERVLEHTPPSLGAKAGGFVLPDPEGTAPPKLERVEGEDGEGAVSTLTIPVVPLPPEAGRHTLTLPPLPITMARASGDVFVVCTEPHEILVEDPLANEPGAPPRPNPEPRRQREVWTRAQELTLMGLVTLAVGALVAWLLVRFRRKRPQGPPPPPPRPPWEVAHESLRDIAGRRLIEGGRLEEHFDQVSDTIRKYLGDRYGFDGLESTSHEAIRILESVRPVIPNLPEMQAFLRQADLVKFARRTPGASECADYLKQAESIVDRTVPPPEFQDPEEAKQ